MGAVEHLVRHCLQSLIRQRREYGSQHRRDCNRLEGPWRPRVNIYARVLVRAWNGQRACGRCRGRPRHRQPVMSLAACSKTCPKMPPCGHWRRRMPFTTWALPSRKRDFPRRPYSLQYSRSLASSGNRGCTESGPSPRRRRAFGSSRGLINMKVGYSKPERWQSGRMYLTRKTLRHDGRYCN